MTDPPDSKLYTRYPSTPTVLTTGYTPVPCPR